MTTPYVIEQFRKRYPFPLDDFQEEAIGILAGGDSVMVAAPTGTGKTIVAEFGIYKASMSGGRVMYTTPIKALSNQKFRDLRAVYGAEDVGLLTGDIIENRTARIVVMTTEVLRNMLLQSPEELADVSAIIFDEVHYLADIERGTAWEEAIILCPPHVQLICLSATVANAEEIAQWISETHSPIRLITHTKRAVPLSYYYYFDKQLQLVIDSRGRQVLDFNVGGENRAGFQGNRGPSGGSNGRGRGSGRGGSSEHSGRGNLRDRLKSDELKARQQTEPEPREIVTQLDHLDLLPAIYFLFSRRDCEQAAEEASAYNFASVKRDIERINDIISNYMARLNEEDRNLAQVKTIIRLTRRGVAYHHAGLLPILKQLVEELFSSGLLRVVFATDTLALGVNMPARTVVIGRMSKYDGTSRRPLLPNEFQQMAGRAGRRGIDKEGHIVIPYSPWVTFREAIGIAVSNLLPVESAFSIHYNAVLNLWDPPTGQRVLNLMRRSLLQFQQARRLREQSGGLRQYQQELAAIPFGCLIGYPEGEILLDEYESMGRDVSLLRKSEEQAKREVERVEARLTSQPWELPRRDSLRHAFRDLTPGAPFHTVENGWVFYLGKGTAFGDIALYLYYDEAGQPQIAGLKQYSSVDFFPPDAPPIELPIQLEEPAYRSDIAAMIGEQQAASLGRRVQEALALLPDLEQWKREHQEKLGSQLADQIKAAREVAATTQQEAHDSNLVLRKHPCEDCPRRKEHRGYRRERAGFETLIRDEEKQLARRKREEETRLERTLRGIVSVLEGFDYLRQGQPTRKTVYLANVFDRNALVLSEAVVNGYFDNLNAPDLAECLSWYAYDRETDFPNQYYLPRHLVTLRRELQDLELGIFKAEREQSFTISTGFNPRFYGAARDWCKGVALKEILGSVEMSEGDIVQTLNKTLDLLRQMRDMLLAVQRQTGREEPLLGKVREAEKLLKRGVVELATNAIFGPLSDETIAQLDADVVREPVDTVLIEQDEQAASTGGREQLEEVE